LPFQPHELSSFNTFETNKAKMEAIFNIGYESAKASYAEISDMDKTMRQTP
jgi:NTE family protein